MSFARDFLDILQNSIEANVDLQGRVTGGYWDVWLSRGGSAPTAGAFYEDGTVLTNIVILDPDLNPNAQYASVPDAVDADLTVWIYSNDDDQGWSDVAAFRTYIYSLLADESFDMSDGTIAFPLWTGDLATRRNHEEFQGSIVGNVQFRVVYQRARVPA